MIVKVVAIGFAVDTTHLYGRFRFSFTLVQVKIYELIWLKIAAITAISKPQTQLLTHHMPSRWMYTNNKNKLKLL